MVPPPASSQVTTALSRSAQRETIVRVVVHGEGDPPGRRLDDPQVHLGPVIGAGLARQPEQAQRVVVVRAAGEGDRAVVADGGALAGGGDRCVPAEPQERRQVRVEAGGRASAAATSAPVASTVTVAPAASWGSNGLPTSPSRLSRTRGTVTAMRVGPCRRRRLTGPVDGEPDDDGHEGDEGVGEGEAEQALGEDDAGDEHGQRGPPEQHAGGAAAAGKQGQADREDGRDADVEGARPGRTGRVHDAVGGERGGEDDDQPDQLLLGPTELHAVTVHLASRYSQGDR